MAAESGGIALQFGLLLVPLMLLAGGSIDLGNVYRIRTALQNASDAASVGSLTKQSPAYIAAQTMPGNGSISAGVADATNLFNANITGLSGTSAITVTPAVTKSSLVLSSTVNWSATVPMTFLGLIPGQSNWTIAGTSKSTASLPQYLDFYLMVDVSGSMSFPSTPLGQTRLATVSQDDKSQYPTGCQFACHFAGYLGYYWSRNGGNALSPQVSSCPTPDVSACIQLRTDAVGVAIQQLLQTAKNTESVSNQYRIGLYPFIAYLMTYYPITSDITSTGVTSLSYAASQISNLLDTGVNTSLGSGGTHFENAFPTMNSLIKTIGTGASQSSPLPFVFLITDGSQDNQYYTTSTGWYGSNQATTLNPALCTQLKNHGITISVLYIPYQTILNPNASFAGNEDGAANNNIPYIPAALTSCASPNFFFTANSPADITNALAAMFNQAVAEARITN